MDLRNKTAYITGGTKGIGLAIAEAMLEEGMNVAITARNQDQLTAVANQLNSKFPDKVLAIANDVRDYQGQTAAVQAIQSKWGNVDVLIANAGLGHFASIEDLSTEQWNETIDVNLTGVFNSVKACIPSLKNSKGYIFTIASLAGTNFFAKGSAYNASKFGLVGFTQAVMMDLRNYGIRVSTIMPGSVATHFNNNIPAAKDDWKIQPEDLGQMIVDLLKINARTLPSKIEVRPSVPAKK